MYTQASFAAAKPRASEANTGRAGAAIRNAGRALIGVLMRTAGASRCCSSSSESAHDSSRSVACRKR